MAATKDRIMEEMKDAMRNKDKVKLETLRSLKAALQTDLSQGELTEAMEQEIVNKQLKRRNEAVKMYTDAGRTELAEKETAEAEIIKTFLPKQLTDEEVSALIEELYSAGATTMPLMMKDLMPKVKGLADGKRVQELVKERLG